MKQQLACVLLSLSAMAATQETGHTKQGVCRPGLALHEFLLPEDVTAARLAFTSFRQALLHGDRKAISEHVKFPLEVVIGGLPVRLSDPDALSQRFGDVFNPFVTSSIKLHTADKLIVNWEGVATPDRAVTFEKDGDQFKVSNIRTRSQKSNTVTAWLAQRLTCPPVVVEGRVAAYNWASRMPRFENIYVEHLLWDVSKFLSGNVPSTRIRVDFWGVSHLPDYNLPDDFTQPGKLWRIYLRPAGQAPLNDEVCGEMQTEVRFVDPAGKEGEKKSAIVPVPPSSVDELSYTGLACFEVYRQFIVPVTSPSRVLPTEAR